MPSSNTTFILKNTAETCGIFYCLQHRYTASEMRTSFFLQYILLHQLQEGFGWDPFIHLFSDYQKMSSIPKDNPSKMNLWAQKFSQEVNKNLAPFFIAWGWPIKKELSVELSSLPSWDQDPMRSYRP